MDIFEKRFPIFLSRSLDRFMDTSEKRISISSFVSLFLATRRDGYWQITEENIFYR